ncbi:hypothetical protein [Demequina litorisediminis]|uniref:hypothetical protein n=1 Tax=Demequina litorisediminis TaxID=1849022 RepID=UPI0032AEA262
MIARVWAPDAASVGLVIGAADAPAQELQRGDDGWWSGPDLPPGTDYGYVVDGEGPWPDPRSARQVAGVHGLSRVFDASRFAWTDASWSGMDVLGKVFYEPPRGCVHPAGHARRRRGPVAVAAVHRCRCRRVDARGAVPRPARLGL